MVCITIMIHATWLVINWCVFIYVGCYDVAICVFMYSYIVIFVIVVTSIPHQINITCACDENARFLHSSTGSLVVIIILSALTMS